ncbi:unnamed protein product, partial [marine sediment metagenome]
MNELLKHQIDKFLGGVDSLPEELEALFKAISDAYDGFDDDRSLPERASDLSPQELVDTNIGLRKEIAERKQAEEELRSSEERLKVLFESAPDGYYLLDTEGKFIDGNKAAEEMVGYDRGELIGKTFVDAGLARPEDMPELVGSFVRSLQGEATGPDECVLVRKDGSTVAVEIRAFPASIAGKFVVLGSARDITARKKVEGELRRSEEHFRALIDNAIHGILL